MRTDLRPGLAPGPRKALLPLGIAVLVLVGTLLPVEARAAQVTFLWDYEDPRAAGFNLYCGPSSGFYDIRMDVGNTTSATVNGFTQGSTVHCSVTAYASATEESGFSNEIEVVPQARPIPDFSMSAKSGMAPLSVTFAAAITDPASGPVSRWQWDFGDGTGITLSNLTGVTPIEHVYDTPGRYTVVLTAIGPGGSVSTTADAASIITVGGTNAIIGAVRSAVSATIETLPATSFTISGTTGVAPFTVQFTNTTTRASDWLWNFGDGAFSSERSPAHTYHLPGTYKVELTATGPGGTASKTASTPISVGAPPLVPIGSACFSGPGVLFGDQSPGTEDVSPVRVARAFSTTACRSGSVGSLSMYLESNSTATGLVLGLYSDANGHPGSLLAQGSAPSPIAGAWNTISISPTDVDMGEVYWIAILGTQTGDVHFHTKAGGCAAETSEQIDLTALPASWTTGAVEGACQVSVYGSSTQ